MPDERRAPNADLPTPYLRTRPATVLTAIGLCLALLVIQFVPDLRDASAGRGAGAVTAGSR
ncbi:MAG: hypothetical protein K2Y40_04070 [Reyranella sp.]|nr:hypothetical protein [Reyranella sp.]